MCLHLFYTVIQDWRRKCFITMWLIETGPQHIEMRKISTYLMYMLLFWRQSAEGFVPLWSRTCQTLVDVKVNIIVTKIYIKAFGLGDITVQCSFAGLLGSFFRIKKNVGTHFGNFNLAKLTYTHSCYDMYSCFKTMLW